MQGWLKSLLWICAVFVLVWLVVIVHWQNTSRLPSESDLVVYLGLVPLLLAMTGWGVYKLATRSLAPSGANVAASDSKSVSPSTQGKQGNSEQEKTWTLNIVETSLHTSAGNSAAEVLGKLKDGSLENELDPELKDAGGFAVFSARIADLEVLEGAEALTHWQKTSGYPELQWSEMQLRTLHLARLSILELAPVACQHPSITRYMQLKESGRNPEIDAVLPLRLVLVWPEYWAAAHQTAASLWVKALVAQHGWPEQRVLLQGVKPDHANPIALLDYINVTAGRAQLPTVGILLACESCIEQRYVDSLASQGKLFGGKNTSGVKPGELSAGLLFADAQQGQLINDGPFSRLHRASWALREKSADDRGKITSDLLSTLVALALDTAKVTTEKIKFISADNDHKPNREAELAQMLTTNLPDIDALKDVAKVSQACGSTLSAATVAALCVAHQYVVDEQAPTFCISLGDPFTRAAVALSAQPTG